MPSIIFVNPIKPGKLNDAKKFMEVFMGPRKAEYIDLLKRYGLKNAKSYYHKIGTTEFAVVIHEVEAGKEHLVNDWPISTHPFDIWFKEELAKIHDFEYAGVPTQLLDFEV